MVRGANEFCAAVRLVSVLILCANGQAPLGVRRAISPPPRRGTTWAHRLSIDVAIEFNNMGNMGVPMCDVSAFLIINKDLLLVFDGYENDMGATWA